MKKVRINRAKWRAGAFSTDNNRSCGLGETALCNDDGFKCCLGFAAQQLSHKPLHLINDIAEPSDLEFVVSPLNQVVPTEGYSRTIDNTELSKKAMAINDNELTTLKQKERLLINLFAKHGVELQFFGEYTHEKDQD